MKMVIQIIFLGFLFSCGDVAKLEKVGGSGLGARGVATAEELKECSVCPALVEVQLDKMAYKYSKFEDIEEIYDWDVVFNYKLYVSKFEITQQEYNYCVEEGFCEPITFYPQSNKAAADKVAYQEANSYVRWLSKKTNQLYRLPTEAEWVYFATNGGRSRFWWGNKFDNDMLNCPGCEVAGRMMELPKKDLLTGQYPVSQFGLYDVLGNVREWVVDCGDYVFEGLAKNGGRATDGSAWKNSYDQCGCSRLMTKGGAYVSHFEGVYPSSVGLRSNLNYGECDAQIERVSGSFAGDGIRVVRDIK